MSVDGCKAPALAAGLRLIEALAGNSEPQGLSELARQAGTNKNMASRLLATLQAEAWVETCEPGPRYQLTLRPFAIAGRAPGRRSLVESAREPLRTLWAGTGESVYLGVPHRSQVLYLEHLDATGPVRIAGCAGGLYPLHCTAPGKALLAHLGDQVLADLATAGLPRLTAETLTDPAALAADLAEVRARGFATDNEEFGRGILCLAAPVFDARGRPVAALGMSTTTIGYTLATLVARHAAAVVAAAAAVSIRLGWQSAIAP